MSLPPRTRVPYAASHRRAREAAWWLALVILLLLCGWVLTPEPWRAEVKTRVARWWHWDPPPAEKDLAHDERSGPEWSLQPTRETPHEEPLIAPTFAPPAVNSMGSRALGSTKEKSGRRADTGDLTIQAIAAAVVSSPVYQITGGGKPFTPRQWVRVQVQFTSTTDLARLAMAYEINLGAGGRYSGAILHEDVTAYRKTIVVAYLVPARARLVGERIAGVRVAAYADGRLLDHSEFRRPGRFADAGIAGFLRPKSLTPFAPLDWDDYLPDSGFADVTDIKGFQGQGFTTLQTSTGTTPPTR